MYPYKEGRGGAGALYGLRNLVIIGVGLYFVFYGYTMKIGGTIGKNPLEVPDALSKGIISGGVPAGGIGGISSIGQGGGGRNTPVVEVTETKQEGGSTEVLTSILDPLVVITPEVTEYVGDPWQGLGNYYDIVGDDDLGIVRITHYYPPYGGLNCFNFVDDYCISPMYSGKRWEDWMGRAMACPERFPIGSIIGVDPYGGGTYLWFPCLDRGGMIICNDDGLCVFDVLTDRPVDGMYNAVIKY